MVIQTFLLKNFYKNKRLFKLPLILLSLSLFVTSCGGDDDNRDESGSEHSIARQWNEVLLEAIRNDFARPTVHARNLFHVSSAMYDAWSVFDENATGYLLGKTVDGFSCDIENNDLGFDENDAVEEAISYAAYRLIAHRFALSPGNQQTMALILSLMESFEYSVENTSIDYRDSPAALGNYIAQCYIDFGLQDGSNEENNYDNRQYNSVNLPITPEFPGNSTLSNPSFGGDWNRWQQIVLSEFIDQSGNNTDIPEFLSPEWGEVTPFSLREDQKTLYRREGETYEYNVYFDPGSPPLFEGDLAEEYKWGFTLVGLWSAHLDHRDGVIWDISPRSIGNIQSFPQTFEEYRNFYNTLEGGDPGQGYELNPKTGAPYESQMVARGDYSRVLAEFWADGPDSETPPGHWFTILNTVSDHPELVKRIENTGDVVDNLEWDIKAYFTLGGAMHDAAVAAWGIKGWYDYVRPVSVVRALSDLGQSSDPDMPSYDPNGIPLYPNFIELVFDEDPLAGEDGQNIGKIKMRAWRGPSFIDNPETDQAGVGWILAENWWPYQRPTFVTPPFAGYVSGHSTYSRAAAEVLTAFTGDEFFPGGMSEFEVTFNEFLVFEEGPSQSFTLQWATYRDASDQCSLSRIWGGIHPPADDIPGRLIGEQIGVQAYEFARSYYQ